MHYKLSLSLVFEKEFSFSDPPEMDDHMARMKEAFEHGDWNVMSEAFNIGWQMPAHWSLEIESDAGSVPFLSMKLSRDYTDRVVVRAP